MSLDRESPPRSTDVIADAAGDAAPAPRERSGIALIVLAVAAVIFMLHWAQDVLIPIALAVFLSYLLGPSVSWLKRRLRLPNAVGGALVLALVMGVLVAGGAALEPQARNLLDVVPAAAKKLDRQLRRSAMDKGSAMAKMKEAAAELEKAAASATDAEPSRGGRAKASAETPGAPRTDRLFMVGTTTVVAGIANAVVVIALVYFLLVAGDSFKRKLVRVSGETLSQKRITVEILDEIDRQTQRYLLAHVATSALLGVATWIAFVLIGFENAPFWAVAAAVLHLIPYVGPAVTVALTGLVAYLQFDGLQQVGMVIGSQVVIAYLVGLMLMPWLTEKMARINAVTIFISLLFWGWLWGVWGLLLGVPIMLTIKSVCERVEGLQPVAEMLGYEPPRPKPQDADVNASA